MGTMCWSFTFWIRSNAICPFDGAVRFVDLETGQEVVAQAHELRKSYERAMTQWQAELLKCCNSHDIDYVQLTTQDPLDKGLVNYLATRSEMY